MAIRNGDRAMTPSDAEFSLSILNRQLTALPGDIEDPTNAAWQASMIDSIEHKAAIIQRQAPDLMPSLLNKLTVNTERLRSFGVGAVMSAVKLEELATTLTTDQDHGDTSSAA